MKAGDTFRVTFATGRSLDDHIQIVASDPERDPHSVLLFNFTKWAPYKDQACVVKKEDHLDLRVESCVFYEKARTVSVQQIQMLAASGLVKWCRPLSPELLKRVWESVDDSRIEIQHHTMLRAQGLV